MTSLENAITGNVIVYQAENESVSTNVLFKDETFWMTQKDMAKLFDVNVPAISKHLKNIFESGELDLLAVISKMETTAEEIIHSHADATKNHMGLTTWESGPEGRIYKKDVIIAKNYLSVEEIEQLERTVSSFFDYIERIIERHETFTMKAFIESVDKFLDFNEYQILTNKGLISMTQAQKKAVREYKAFNAQQKVISDFDKFVKEHS